MTNSEISPSDDHAAADTCSIEKIEGRWTLQILLCLRKGEHRFSDIKAEIPRISANVLTDRLRALESAGLVERHYLPPPHASWVYTLATLAAGLKRALDVLANWQTDLQKQSHPAGRPDWP
mgnify:CR=1 FL=1